MRPRAGAAPRDVERADRDPGGDRGGGRASRAGSLWTQSRKRQLNLMNSSRPVSVPGKRRARRAGVVKGPATSS
jgi:hypothetical protein